MGHVSPFKGSDEHTPFVKVVSQNTPSHEMHLGNHMTRTYPINHLISLQPSPTKLQSFSALGFAGSGQSYLKYDKP